MQLISKSIMHDIVVLENLKDNIFCIEFKTNNFWATVWSRNIQYGKLHQSTFCKIVDLMGFVLTGLAQNMSGQDKLEQLHKKFLITMASPVNFSSISEN